MAHRPSSFVPAPTFLPAPKPPRTRCRACGKPGGVPREEAKGIPICAACYHKRANAKLLEVAAAKFAAWLRGE